MSKENFNRPNKPDYRTFGIMLMIIYILYNYNDLIAPMAIVFSQSTGKLSVFDKLI